MTDHAAVRVSRVDKLCRLRLYRPENDNAIDTTMVRECHAVLDEHERDCTVVVVEGLPEVFCSGADFSGYRGGGQSGEYDPAPLYDLWTRLSEGPFVTVAHVRGRTTAGGVGFVAASDIVIADQNATFALSELLFGLYPAMVLPFLSRRVGYQHANYLTLTTKAVTAKQAERWGLVDVCAERSEVALAQHLSRLTKLPKQGITAYKRFMADLAGGARRHRDDAVAANRAIFTEPANVERITRFAQDGTLPWETSTHHRELVDKGQT
jgi:polyketide biosynthesis enoyl-CoA hydratase PksH